jgi:HJR/Mrr/RecB family endonuclease
MIYITYTVSGMEHMRAIGYIMIISAVIFLILYIYRKVTSYINEKELQNALKNSGISQIDELSPFEFEEWIARMLRTDGYKANATKKSGDYGADVIAEKDGIKIAIQVKKINQPVGIKAVQEVISAIGYYDCYEGWVITSANSFTTAAINLAKKNNIKLFTRNDLALLLHQIQRNENVDNNSIELAVQQDKSKEDFFIKDSVFVDKNNKIENKQTEKPIILKVGNRNSQAKPKIAPDKCNISPIHVS